MQCIGENELYEVINRTLAKLGKIDGEPINKEITIFKERHSYYIQNNPIPSLFEGKRLTANDIELAQKFCNALEDYRQATDIYAKDNPVLTEESCRSLTKGLEVYREHIWPENQLIIGSLENIIKSILPETRNQYILEEYNKQAKLIYSLRKKRTANINDCEKLAVAYFKDVLNDDELKKIESCPQKIELYENTLKIVDCLPKNKYNRTTKLQLKSQLCYGIWKANLQLPQYDPAKAKYAYDEYHRYRRAIENISRYLNKNINAEILRKKQEDEWLYK